jgi:diguanylate cyclase (GGDEF)-like protein
MFQEPPSGNTILVVEDNEVVRMGLGLVLRQQGYTVSLAANGQQALDCLAGGLKPDLILLDMLTPFLDGWHLLEQRKRDTTLAGAPVIILTGIGIASAEWAASLGADGYLHKPFEVEALLREVRRCCRKGDPSDPAASDPLPASHRPQDSSTMKLLIAEDQVSLGLMLQEQVRPWGYEATVVTDGQAALDTLLGADAPRLALLDWMMPGPDGIEVCRRVRREAAERYPYLVLLTGQGGHQQRIDGLEAGADDFLVKPVDATELKARLTAGKRIISLQEQLLASQRQLREQASRDALTGLWNRAAILDLFNRELMRGRREGRPVGLVMGDLDHFKQVNDTFGHLTGDQVLRQAAARLREGVRPYDTVGRYGGEEFLVVLPGCGSEEAVALAERLRKGVGDQPIDVGERLLTVTFSLGVAAWDSATPANATELLRVADEALYEAKRAGRNRAVLGTRTAADEPAERRLS